MWAVASPAASSVLKSATKVLGGKGRRRNRSRIWVISAWLPSEPTSRRLRS